MNRQIGFTLVELMVTVAIAAIVLTLGVPAFQETINSSRLTSTANEFVTALNLARSEAVKRSVRVTVCKSADGATCAAGGGYEQGWIVFVDPNNNATVDAGEQVIRAYGPLSGGLTLIGRVVNNVDNVGNFVSYTSSGSSKLATGAFQAGTLDLCRANYTTQSRQIVIARGGRTQVRVMRPADNACP
jgi:type IV fimbrial biogenesis protein FimT